MIPTLASATEREWDATRTLARFFHHLDERNYAAASALFTPDGYWVRQGEKLIGPVGVEAALSTRPATLATRHLISNLVAEADEHGVSIRYYITVFDGTVEDGATPKLAAPAFLFVAEDWLVMVGEAHRFASREARPVFKRA